MQVFIRNAIIRDINNKLIAIERSLKTEADTLQTRPDKKPSLVAYWALNSPALPKQPEFGQKAVDSKLPGDSNLRMLAIWSFIPFNILIKYLSWNTNILATCTNNLVS